jgi:lipopolysaccharide heptosyltransferase I
MIGTSKFLVIRLGSLGDIIHALPACQSLKKSYPDALIDWIVEAKHAHLLSAVDFLNRIITIDTQSLRKMPWQWSEWHAAGRSIGVLRANSYDVAIDFQGLLKTAFLGLLSGARKRVGFPASLVREKPAHWFYHQVGPHPAGPQHVTQLNLSLLRSVGCDGQMHPIEFKPDAEAEQIVATQLAKEAMSRFLVVNPGGGWPTKRWNPERYGILAQRIIKELGYSVIVTTGPGEEQLYREMALKTEEPLLHLQLSFIHLIPLLRRAHLFIGGDTGPFHLACALGTPVVGIFGPTSPARNGPWPGPDRVVHHVLPCSDCYGRSCPTANECMDISVEEVLQQVRIGLEKTEEHGGLRT